MMFDCMLHKLNVDIHITSDKFDYEFFTLRPRHLCASVVIFLFL